VTKIPVLRFRTRTRSPLLEADDGAVAPKAWRGGMPISITIGPAAGESAFEGGFEWEIKRALRRDWKNSRGGISDEW